METIRMYLDNMFLKLPKTKEVIMAKQELLSMMEDKYEELRREGKSDNEAIGIVISEFGNLDELAKELGISEEMNQLTIKTPQGRFVNWEEAGNFMKVSTRSAVCMAAGVMLCIWSPMMLVMNDERSNWQFGHKIMESVSLMALLVKIAIAVGLFIYSGTTLERFSYLKNEKFYLDYETRKYMTDKSRAFKTVHTLGIFLGVILCVISPVPLVVLDEWMPNAGFLNGVCVAALLFLVGIAVFLFVSSGIRMDAFQTLLKEKDKSQ